MAYHIRLMEPRDLPAVQRLHEEQNRRDGTNYPLTPVFDESYRLMPNVALALVICNGEEVTQGVVFETSVEMMLSGCDPRATAELHNQIGACFCLLAEKGFTSAHCFVPKDVVIPVEKPLKRVGFVSTPRLVHFIKDLRPAPEPAEQE
jgi:hypothetical protein